MYVSMKDMLLHAHRNNYAVMAINCVNMEQVKAVIESAEEEKSAVIINISPRQMKAHGYGYIMAPLIENLAKRASVPVAFNLDHGANFEDITAAMQYGFSSVMIDSSSYEFEENVRRTQQIASLAHGMGLSCEAELGHVGQAAQADDSNVDLYTNVKQAKEFVERTNCDCLAVAIGTAHGAYPKGMIPKLDFERLKELKAELDMPLVLPGGSGAGEDKEQTGYKTINTGCLCDSTTKKHGRCNITLAFRLTSDCFQCTCNCITFTNTRADTCDQRTSCSNCTSC